MNLEELKEVLRDFDMDDAVVFENPAYISAVVGRTDDGRVIYDFDKMVESLMKEDGISQEDAIDFIDYNTIRASPYMGSKAPVIMYSLEGVLHDGEE